MRVLAFRVLDWEGIDFARSNGQIFRMALLFAPSRYIIPRRRRRTTLTSTSDIVLPINFMKIGSTSSESRVALAFAG